MIDDAAIDERFHELRKLKYDWDSYKGAPIAESVIGVAKSILDIMNYGHMSIVPTAPGGVDLEWHWGRDNEISISITPTNLTVDNETFDSGKVKISFFIDLGGKYWEFEEQEWVEWQK